jgi:hypothetical protein
VDSLKRPQSFPFSFFIHDTSFGLFWLKKTDAESVQQTTTKTQLLHGEELVLAAGNSGLDYVLDLGLYTHSFHFAFGLR